MCKGRPGGAADRLRKAEEVALSEQAQRYLSQRSIRCEIVPAAQFVDVYNKSKARKAALIHVTG